MSNKLMIILEPNYYIKCNQIMIKFITNFNALKNLICASKDVLLFLCTYVPLWTIKIWRNKNFFRNFIFIVHKKKGRKDFFPTMEYIQSHAKSSCSLFRPCFWTHQPVHCCKHWRSTCLNNLTIKSKRIYSFELKVDLKHHLLHRSWTIRIESGKQEEEICQSFQKPEDQTWQQAYNNSATSCTVINKPGPCTWRAHRGKGG